MKTRQSHTICLTAALLATLFYVHYGVSGTAFVSGATVLMNAFTAVADVCVVLALYLPLARGRRHLIWIPSGLVLAAGLACVWYSRFFGGYIHVSALTQTQNLVGLGESIRATLRWSDFLLCGVVSGLAFLGSRKAAPGKGFFRHLACCLVGIGCGVAFYFVFQGYSSCRNGRTFSDQIDNDWGGYAVRRDIFVYSHGFTVGIVCDILHSHRQIELTEEQRQEIELAVDKPPFTMVCEKPRRLVFIIVESLISDVVGQKVDGLEITPVLNRQAENSLYFSRVQSQIHDGYSSDGQFIYFTGLLPMRVGFTVAEYGDNAYAGLATAAKRQGFRTMMINPATHDYWRQDAMCAAYGIDRQYSIEDYHGICGVEAKGEWLDDEEVFDFAYKCFLKHRDEPIFATILTSTMHYPYDAPFPESGINPPRVESEAYAHYLQKAHYTDRELGRFLSRLEAAGLLDDATLVICSDHHTGDAKESRDLPLMIAAKGIAPATNKEIVGQIDIFPTMLNLMGYSQTPWMGLGQSLLSSELHAVSFDELQRVSELIIESNYLELK